MSILLLPLPVHLIRKGLSKSADCSPLQSELLPCAGVVFLIRSDVLSFVVPHGRFGPPTWRSACASSPQRMRRLARVGFACACLLHEGLPLLLRKLPAVGILATKPSLRTLDNAAGTSATRPFCLIAASASSPVQTSFWKATVQLQLQLWSAWSLSVLGVSLRAPRRLPPGLGAPSAGS